MAKGRNKDAAKRKKSKQRKKCDPGFLAKANGKTLRSYEVGALPIINHILRRMRLPEILREFLPPSDARTELPAYRTLLVLLRNILVAREPIYGLGQLASRFAPDLLVLYPDEVELLNDDRAGRALEQRSARSGRSADLDGIGPLLGNAILCEHRDAQLLDVSAPGRCARAEPHRTGAERMAPIPERALTCRSTKAAASNRSASRS